MGRNILLLCCAVLVCVTLAGCMVVSGTTASTTATPDTVSVSVTASAVEENTTVPLTTVQRQTTQPVTEPTDAVSIALPVVKVTNDPAEPPIKTKKPVKTTSSDEAGTVTQPVRDKKLKYIAFTFDDGPDTELTYKFVDRLARYGGVGTFFVVGNRVSGDGARAVKYAYDNGCEIGVHGYTHQNYYDTCSSSVFKSELSKTSAAIKKATGVTPTLMRPIGGRIISSRVKSSGYDVIIWNVDSADWRYKDHATAPTKKANINKIVNNVLSSVDDGDIILMHEIYYNSYDAFCKLTETLYNRGYRFLTVSQLLSLDSSPDGALYYSAS